MKKLLQKSGIALVLGVFLTIGSVAYAMATIPAACATPGTCTDISATFQALVAETSLRFLDSDASNFVALQAPATVSSDVTFTLPDADGTAGQALKTDGAGNLSFDQVDKRVGEIVHMTSRRFSSDAVAIAMGYLPVKAGTVTNGAVDYPVWALMYPEFISGNNIVFPSDVNGMFLRNTSGNATTEGSIQGDATSLPNSSFSTNSAGSHSHSHEDSYTDRFEMLIGWDFDNDPVSVPRGGQSAKARVNESGGEGLYMRNTISSQTTNSSGSHAHSITSGGDSETRPANRAYQLYTIVDTY